MPTIEQVPEAARAELANWMKSHLERVEAEAEARVALAKTVIEHPSDLMRPLVKHFAGMGIPKAQIARLLVMSPSTLATHYETELDLGTAEANLAVAQNAYKAATDPANGNLSLKWLERRGGEEWKRPVQELAINKPAAGPPVIDSTRLTYAERQQMRAMLQRINEGGEGEPLQADEEPLIGG
jgi:hypothetical protein